VSSFYGSRSNGFLSGPLTELARDSAPPRESSHEEPRSRSFLQRTLPFLFIALSWRRGRREFRREFSVISVLSATRGPQS